MSLQKSGEKLLRKRTKLFVILLFEVIRDDDQGKAGHILRADDGKCQALELPANHANGRNAFFRQLDRVVDTPRCASPSIPEPADHDIRLEDLVDSFFGRLGGVPRVQSRDDTLCPVLLDSQLFEPRNH